MTRTRGKFLQPAVGTCQPAQRKLSGYCFGGYLQQAVDRSFRKNLFSVYPFDSCNLKNLRLGFSFLQIFSFSISGCGLCKFFKVAKRFKFVKRKLSDEHTV